jgi:hypothetical protein
MPTYRRSSALGGTVGRVSGGLSMRDGHDDVVAVVRRLLADQRLPAECDWAGLQWDDGRVFFRVTVVAWPPGEAGELVKVVVECAQQLATFGVPGGPAPFVSRYLDLSEDQRRSGWEVYLGDPQKDRNVWNHLAWTVRQVRDSFGALEVHSEHDRTFGLVIRRPASTVH